MSACSCALSSFSRCCLKLPQLTAAATLNSNSSNSAKGNFYGTQLASIGRHAQMRAILSPALSLFFFLPVCVRARARVRACVSLG